MLNHNRDRASFQPSFDRAVTMVRELVTENSHTVALMAARDFLEMVGDLDGIQSADREALEALHDLQQTLGEMTPAMTALRSEIAARLTQRSLAAGMTQAELRDLGLSV